MNPARAAEGRVAVVTGASAGMGRAVASEFARHGWRVALLARGADGLEGARSEVDQLGGEALVLAVDVADEAQVEAAAAQVQAQWGRIDVWVNNAMATIFSDAALVSPAEFRRATEVTYFGAVWGTMAALKRMKSRNEGTVVQVGSALAYRSIPLQAPYCGAKAALRGFTDSLRCELAHEHSRVHLTMVQLSAFNTPHAVQAILGTRVVPGLLDRILGARAVEGQQTDQPLPANRRDNLWRPVPGYHGIHGRFDAQAIAWSTQLWLTTHRPVAIAVAIALLLLPSVAQALA